MQSSSTLKRRAERAGYELEPERVWHRDDQYRQFYARWSLHPAGSQHLRGTLYLATLADVSQALELIELRQEALR